MEQFYVLGTYFVTLILLASTFYHYRFNIYNSIMMSTILMFFPLLYVTDVVYSECEDISCLIIGGSIYTLSFAVTIFYRGPNVEFSIALNGDT